MSCLSFSVLLTFVFYFFLSSQYTQCHFVISPLSTKSFFVNIISDNVYFIHSYRNLKEKTEIQISTGWYTWYLPWWHVMSLWSAWHAATSRDTSQRHTGCRNPRCRLAHHITLHYITSHYFTLHYITLHYITAQIVPSAGQCTGSKRALFLHN